jgi:hypothetical protein
MPSANISIVFLPLRIRCLEPWGRFRGNGIANLPKIKIKLLPATYPIEDVFDLEQARERLNFNAGMIMIDGKRIQSYEELVELVSQDKYQGQEFVEIVGILPVAGG